MQLLSGDYSFFNDDHFLLGLGFDAQKDSKCAQSQSHDLTFSKIFDNF